jgi:pimeloyl-ACP methyl ester carboxylesterase
MKKNIAITICCLLLSFNIFANSNGDSSFTESAIVLHTSTGDLFGTFTIPNGKGQFPVALIIAGSGPTDRNGNNPMMKNESLKKLAYGLAEQHIASLRFDKRGIAESEHAAKSEEALRFEDYVNDARAWIELLKKDKRFLKVVVVGHSEGSLIGMIAANGLADGYVSIAGAGRSADKVLKEQLGSQPQQVIDMCFPIIDSLVAGKTVADVNPMLNALFRPGVQPYLISWFHYDPQLEIKKLTIPVLIIQGTSDIQVSIPDANLLAAASPKAQLILIKNMNHIFRLVEGDRDANIATYSKGELPISKELVNSIALFTLKK